MSTTSAPNFPTAMIWSAFGAAVVSGICIVMALVEPVKKDKDGKETTTAWRWVALAAGVVAIGLYIAVVMSPAVRTACDKKFCPPQELVRLVRNRPTLNAPARVVTPAPSAIVSGQ